MNQPGKSKVSGSRAYGVAAALLRRLSDIYTRARCYHLTHEDIAELVRDEVKNDQFARLPAYWQGCIDGAWECRRNELRQYHLVWTLFCDGRLLTSEEVDALTAEERASGLAQQPEYRSPWSRIDNNQSRHVWKDAKGQLLRDKPFDRRFKTYLVGGVTLSHEEYEKAKGAH